MPALNILMDRTGWPYQLWLAKQNMQPSGQSKEERNLEMIEDETKEIARSGPDSIGSFPFKIDR